MGCRKNQATMTPAEKAAFVGAVVKLKTQVPSRLHPGDPNRHRYDDYVEVHMNAMMMMDGSNRIPGWAHQGPAFFPWHREMLRQFELDLQQIDYTVTLPYWDWTVEQSNTGGPWTDDFMGAMDPATDRVTSGPFREGAWVKVVFDHDCPDDHTPYLRRALGRPAFQNDPCGLSNVTALPTAGEVAACLNETPYDSPTWGNGVSPSFRDRAEGWHGAGSIHNRVHLWVGGSMLPSTSPNDPIFFLHHCNIDRLWNLWQRLHPAEGYHPTGVGGEAAAAGHNLNDAMIFNDPGQPAPWPGPASVASMLNSHLAPCTYWYDTDPPEVNLLTPSISFVDIPEGIGGTGVTTYRAVQFEVLSCAGATFRITAGPTAPFTAPLGNVTTVPAAHQAPPAVGRVWIAYTSTVSGASATGSVSVHCDETNQDFVITISANTTARPKTAVALVLDHSGSMAQDAGDGYPKAAKLKEAVSAFVSVMLPGDGLSIVRFDDTVQRLFGVTDVGPVTPVAPGSGRDLANQVLAGNQLDPAGATAVGAGIQEGRLALDSAPPTVPPYTVKAMLVVTDGKDNTVPRIADAAASLNANTFAVGIGTPNNISVPDLQALTQGRNGFLVVTGTITPSENFRLIKYFLQALAGITNAQVVLDPGGELVFGAVHRIPFHVVDPDIGIDAILLSPVAGAVDFTLEAPAGQTISPALAGMEPAVQFHPRPDVTYYRLSLPALRGQPGRSHAGLWHAVLRLGKRAIGIDRAAVASRRRVAPYNLLVHAYSTLRMQAALYQKSVEPGAVADLQVTLSEYDVPVEHRARVWAEVTRPDKATFALALGEKIAGSFAGQFVLDQAGLYTARIRAQGSTFVGRPFEREQTLTAAVVPGADRPSASDPIVDWLRDRDKRLCKLLACVLADAGLERQLHAHGIDVARLRKCLGEYCRPAIHETPVAKAPHGEEERTMTPEQIRNLVRALLHEATQLDAPAVATLTEPAPPVIRETVAPAAKAERAERPRFGLSAEDLAAAARQTPRRPKDK